MDADTSDRAAPSSLEAGTAAGTAPGHLMDSIIAALRTVHDPEIPVNVYDLGLIYRIAPQPAGGVEIDMTLTAPGCPVAGELLSWVQRAVSEIAGIEAVTVTLVFDPPWDSSRMSEEVQLELGLL